MPETHAAFSLQDMYDAYPGSDLLGCGPPLAREKPSDYQVRVEHDAGDTLYLFLVRERVENSAVVDNETAAQRLERAIEDLQSVRRAVRGEE